MYTRQELTIRSHYSRVAVTGVYRPDRCFSTFMSDILLPAYHEPAVQLYGTPAAAVGDISRGVCARARAYGYHLRTRGRVQTTLTPSYWAPQQVGAAPQTPRLNHTYLYKTSIQTSYHSRHTSDTPRHPHRHGGAAMMLDKTLPFIEASGSWSPRNVHTTRDTAVIIGNQ